jgi:hypothetical protein
MAKMDRKKIMDRIDWCIEKSRFIKIYTDVEGDEDTHYGIPIGRSGSLVAIQQLPEFHFNGYVVLRLHDIVRVRCGRFETVQQNIVESIGEIRKFERLSWLRLGSWKSALACLKKRNICVCAESGLIRANVFAIGTIHAMKANSVVLKSFDSHGKWCKPKHNIKYADITELAFGDEYSTRFYEYVRRRSS